MRRAERRLVLLIALAAFTFSGPPAALAGDRAADAQRLFDEGLALMRAGTFAEACPRLQESQQLDPGMGTKYRLAECYEGVGLVGSAWKLFVEVAADAKKAGRADREEQSLDHAAALELRLPHLTLVLPAAVAGLPGLEVKCDGEPVAPSSFGRKRPVDAGAHSIEVAAPGKKTWRTTVQSFEGGALAVSVPALEDAAPAAVLSPATPAVAPGAAGRPVQRIAGVATVAVGALGVLAGGILGGLASSRWHGALAGCQGGDPTRCGPTAIGEGHTASALAAGSTTGFVAGGAVLVAGIVIAATAPARKARAGAGWELLPAATRGVAAWIVPGRF